MNGSSQACAGLEGRDANTEITLCSLCFIQGWLNREREGRERRRTERKGMDRGRVDKA